ncbi:MAG TPA: DnaJ domain-containing protein [Alphaproteobacteria bacterium]|nr:DnaJ domain-containing protein [Alphaproteobacteria bacterium]
MELKPGVTWDEVKARYKGLAKQLHPDANGGDKLAEERLKLVNQAYGTLKHSALF